MKKGFTLIELLAVIVILAVIALIATPTVLGIIEDSKKSTMENSANNIVDSVKKEYLSNLAKDETTILTGDVSDLKLDGKKPLTGTWKIIDDSTKASGKAIIVNNVTFASMKGYVCSNSLENEKMTCVKGTAKEMISFVINGNTYKVEEGTTWSEWILSYDLSSSSNSIVWVGLSEPYYIYLDGTGYEDHQNTLSAPGSTTDEVVSNVIKAVTYKINGPAK